MIFICLSVEGQNTDSIFRKVDSLLQKVTSYKSTDIERTELIQLTYHIQNTGFMTEEINHNYADALIYIDKALYIWCSIKDTLKEANNRKYRGYLLAHLNRYTEAKQEISLALKLFSIKNYEFGIAVSKLNFSRVYEMEQKLDSALYYIDGLEEFWLSKKDTGRTIGISHQRINLLEKMKKYTDAKSVQVQAGKLINDRLHWRNVIDHYYLSSIIFKKSGEKKLSDDYKQLYIIKTKSLSTPGNEIHSNYEFDRKE